MHNFIATICAVLIAVGVLAQDNASSLDVRIGIGASLLGTGDMETTMIENELNLTLTRYFAVGGGLAFAKSDRGVFEQASFLQVNSSLFFSPFRNDRRNDFRIGAGVSWYDVSDVALVPSRIDSNGDEISEYRVEQRSSLGWNIILENTYDITSRHLLGLKLFTQPYSNGDINSGILIKLGMKL